MRALAALALIVPYVVGVRHWLALRRDRHRVDVERLAAEHAAYFARLRLVGTRWLNTREAAETAQVSVQTIRAWTRRGLLVGQKDARGHNRYRQSDVLAADLRSRRRREEFRPAHG